ncbi:MFS general substrate transporter [Exidia glandulosa HHB12029]|uniref:MFS general substrate transporter n=1 Tax=Exidia glandulosa HHB12029 TaxID=1314781 RepID=A0A165FGA9_EXIGL|nr:MFS general substrate transporter [Exidia glandulosa HHB12029]
MGEKVSANAAKFHTPASPAKKYFLLALFCVAQFLDAFNISALFSAIPIMSDDLDLSTTESVWLVSAYQLTFASFLLCAGRVSDVYNPKYTFIIGAVVLGVFSIIGGFMTNKIALLVMRAFSGIAAALTIPSSLTLLVRLFPGEREQARAIGVFGGSGALGNVLGLIIGAIFIEFANWHWVFYLAAIISIPIAGVCAFMVPAQPPPEDIEERKLKNLDLPGIAILTSAVVLLIFALTSSGTEGWKSPMVLAPLIISITMIAAFFVWEARTDQEHAAFPPRTWKYPNFPVLFGIALSVFLWFTNVFLVKVQLWQDVYGWSPIKGAIHFLPIGLVAGPITIFAEPICNRFEYKWTIIGSQLLLIISSAIFAFADKDTVYSYWALDFPAMTVGAVGGALLYVTSNVAVFHNTPDEISGTIGAIFNSALQLGSAVGSAIITSLMSGIGKAHPEDPYAGRAAAFWFLFALMVVEAAAVIFFYRPGDHLLQHEGDLETGDAATLSGRMSDEKLKKRVSGCNVEVREARDLERADTMDVDSPYPACATAVATPRMMPGQSATDASVPEIQLNNDNDEPDEKKQQEQV